MEPQQPGPSRWVESNDASSPPRSSVPPLVTPPTLFPGARSPSVTPPTPRPLAPGAGRVASRARTRLLVGSYGGLGARPVRGESFCNCPIVSQGRVRYLECDCGEEEAAGLEWGWDTDTKATASDISADGRIVKFHVNYSCGTAAVKGNMAMTDGQYFWEVKMITPVYGTDMMLGIGTSNVDLGAYRNQFCSLLGRDGESWGLSYMGQLHSKGQMTPYGPRFGQGSIIGIYLDMWHGTLEFYKNRRPLGVACLGLNGKALYPMVSSTAAQSGMKIIKARSFETSLQFMCCQRIRKLIPSHLDICEVLELPPGLRDFLWNNLSWLLRPTELSAEPSPDPVEKEGDTAKRRPWTPGYSSDDEDDDTSSTASSCENCSFSDSDNDDDDAATPKAARKKCAKDSKIQFQYRPTDTVYPSSSGATLRGVTISSAIPSTSAISILVSSTATQGFRPSTVSTTRVRPPTSGLVRNDSPADGACSSMEPVASGSGECKHIIDLSQRQLQNPGEASLPRKREASEDERSAEKLNVVHERKKHKSDKEK